MKNILFMALMILGLVFYFNLPSNEIIADSKVSYSVSTAESFALRGTDSSWPVFADDASILADEPLTKNYYIVLDGSGSMGEGSCSQHGSRMKTAKIALGRFVSNIPKDAGLGLYVFDIRGASERVPLSKGSHDQVISAVNTTKVSGGTPLGEAIRHGVEALNSQAQKQLGYGEYNLVVVTDGDASDHPGTAVNLLVENTPITLHTIGFCINGDHALNQPGVTVYKSADDLQALERGLNEVLAEAPDFDVADFSGSKG